MTDAAVCELVLDTLPPGWKMVPGGDDGFWPLRQAGTCFPQKDILIEKQNVFGVIPFPADTSKLTAPEVISRVETALNQCDAFVLAHPEGKRCGKTDCNCRYLKTESAA